MHGSAVATGSKRVDVKFLECMLTQEKVKVREIQVLLGHLNFVCRVVRAGRTFCRRLGLALLGLLLPHHHVRLSAGDKEDLHMFFLALI